VTTFFKSKIVKQKDRPETVAAGPVGGGTGTLVIAVEDLVLKLRSSISGGGDGTLLPIKSRVPKT
jgi:hypothetical protein